jgi:hypothetical protein
VSQLLRFIPNFIYKITSLPEHVVSVDKMHFLCADPTERCAGQTVILL